MQTTCRWQRLKWPPAVIDNRHNPQTVKERITNTVSQKHSTSLSLPALHAVWRSSFRVLLFPLFTRRKTLKRIWKTKWIQRRRLVACIVYSAKSFIWQLGLSSAFDTSQPSLGGLFEVRCLRLSSGVHLWPLPDAIGSLAQIGDRQTDWQCRVWVGTMRGKLHIWCQIIMRYYRQSLTMEKGSHKLITNSV